MAPQPTRLRTWCTTCQDWALHQWSTVESDHSVLTTSESKDEVTQIVKNDVAVCNDCNSITTSYKFADIPEVKLKEQRARYRAQRQKGFTDILSFANRNP